MSAPTPELKTLGRYNIERVLGKGAMGVVYEGVDPRLGRRVAIKTILKSHLDEDTGKDFAMRFVREAQAVARLNHPNIVQVYDFGEEGDVAYLVMEFIKGKELKNFFDANERFDIKEAVRIMAELCDALDFAHNAGIIHRDIKPANVMLDANARTKLTDFGVARVADSDKTSVERTQAGTMVGTPAYMSPEQITGGTIDKRTDVFSAGIILYQFLTGEKPFTGSGAWTIAKKIIQEEPPLPSSINTSVTPLFDAVVNKALAKDPNQRYQSARDLGNALRRALEGRGDEDDSDKTVVGPMTGPGPAARAPAPRMAGASAEGTSGTKGGATGTQSNQEVELEFWRAIKDGNDPDDFELYVQQFPNGIYAALAKRKIAKLRGIPLDDTSVKAKEQEKKEQEEAARREAEAKTKLEAEKARLEAEMAKREEEYKKRQAEAEARAKEEAEKARAEAQKARAEAAAELEKREAEFKKRQAEQEAKLGMDAKQRAEAEEKARKEAVEKARQEAAAELAKREAEYKKREEESRAKAEQARKEAEEKARQIEEKAKLEAAQRAKAELEAKIKRETEEKKARADAEAREKKNLEERAKREAEFKKREAELKAQAAAGGKKSSPVVPIIVGVVVLAIAAGGYFAFAPDDTAAKKQLEAMQKQLDEAKKKAEALELAKKKEEQDRIALQKVKDQEEAAKKSGDLAKQRELAEARARAEVEARKSADATRLREDEAKKSQAAAEKAKAEQNKVAAEKEKEREKAQQAKVAAEQAAAQKALADAKAQQEALAKQIADAKAATEKAEREAAEARAAAEKAKLEQQRTIVASAPTSGEALFTEASRLEQDGKGREAVKKYMQAAKTGNGKAAKRLGEIYDKGLVGIPRDYAESLKWYNAARVLGEEVPMAKGR